METEHPANHDERFLDDLLDASLAGYSRPAPRLGLEGRVLQRLEEERHAQTLGWLGGWRWAAVGACAVVILAASALWMRRPASPPQISQMPATATKPIAPQPAVAPPRKAAIPAAEIAAVVVPPALHGPRFNVVRPDGVTAAVPAVAAAMPRLASFPAPAPPSEQEILLMRVAATATPTDIAALTRSQEPIQDLSIAPLKIEPLRGSSETPNPGSMPNP